MISLIESSFLHPPKMLFPTDDDLNKHGLTRDQFNEWQKNNPNIKYRKIESALLDPRLQAFMSAFFAMNGKYGSALRSFSHTLTYPEDAEKRNRTYLMQDLEAARKHYNSNPAAIRK